MPANPWLKTITLTTLNTAYSLFTLIQAVDKSVVYTECCKLSIQLDPLAGSAKLRVGNEDISPTNCGVVLQAGQAQIFEMIEQNLYSLKNIYLLSDTSGVAVNITFVVH